jgi:hypothetical protein
MHMHVHISYGCDLKIIHPQLHPSLSTGAICLNQLHVMVNDFCFCKYFIISEGLIQ